MKKDEIVEVLKSNYPREVRKGLVKTIIEKEKSADKFAIKEQYKIINQIFSYVLQQSGWEMGTDSSSWDASPLEVMLEVFPKLSTTKWYNQQHLQTQQKVEIEIQGE